MTDVRTVTARLRKVAAVLIPSALFVWSWLYRYNDPEGGFAGLLDDHFFYLTRGWQMLYGDLPDRDFVDPGAPLTFLQEAAVQWLVGRGTWSEIVFCVTALSLATVLTYLAARRASGSTVIAILAALFGVALHPRYYNYPKVLIYAVAILALWSYLDRPERWKRVALAVMTAVAFLLRHDHGLFLGLATVVTVALETQASWRQRIGHAIVYGLLTLAVLSPYLLFLQRHGGIVTHFATANAFSQRDRARSPLVLPTFALSPRPHEDLPSSEGEWWLSGIFIPAMRNSEPWLFWLLVALPLLTLIALPLSPDGFRARWPLARAKIAIVTLLTIVVDVGFIRGNLSNRFGDVAVPNAILVAWLLHVGWTIVRQGRIGADAGRRVPAAVRAVVGVLVAATVAATTIVFIPSMREELDSAGMTERPLGFIDRAENITARLKTWPVASSPSPDDAGSLRLVYYLRDCTDPGDRVFIAPWMAQVPALAERPFAGGDADRRPSFYTTAADQRLTVARLASQRVPVAIVQAGDDYEGFKKDFPRIDAYLATRYRNVGDFDLGQHVRIRLLVNRDMSPTGTYGRDAWPCFR